MLPYFNMIGQDPTSKRQQANEAQAAAIYQGFRQAGRLLQTAPNALRCLGAVSLRALHQGPQKSAGMPRRDASQTSPC